MKPERLLMLDVSEALFEAAEKLPSGSPWIDAFCNVAQLIEDDVGSRPLSAGERLRRRGIRARARGHVASMEPQRAQPCLAAVPDISRA
jgi:hypothetical protein